MEPSGPVVARATSQSCDVSVGWVRAAAGRVPVFGVPAGSPRLVETELVLSYAEASEAAVKALEEKASGRD